jgi:hypothetical protein
MAQTCTKCSRVNPPEAVYCHFDGVALPGQARNGGPISVATQPFINPFVFPTGRTCRNFDELALACHENWHEARDLLQQGYLHNFLSALGRGDLALAAREAAKFPDRDRGLDGLLGKLPSKVLEAPKLRVEPAELNLGTLALGQDRQVQIHLHNQGMRLLYGTVTCDDCPWLMLGDAPGTPQKHFQIDHETVIPVHVRGNQLRAGNKPLEGKLIVESNGGTIPIVVRVDVPVKPFPSGILAGAKSPRQIAEKARAAPKDAAPLFENGAVAAWYKSNGWTYPVQGPPASGVGAVQQFFEALGLTEPPKVEISERSVGLRGDPGQQLRHVLRLETKEKRPVYAYGKSDQPWLEVGRPQLNGKVAKIPLVIPSVPNKPGQTLTAKVLVQANGNQRFTVPVTLVVGSPAAAVFDFDNAAPPVKPAPMPVAAVPVTLPEPSPPPRTRVRSPGGGFPWVHAVPALLLGGVLLGLVIWDYATKGKGPSIDEVAFADEGDILPISMADSPEPRLDIEFAEPRMRFGIQMSKEPDPQNPGKRKRLTFEERGDSNNTCILLDAQECLFGQSPGEWLRLPKDLTDEPVLRSKLGARDSQWLKSHRNKTLAKVPLVGDRKGYLSIWQYYEGIRVYQTVELVVGEQTRLIDTVLVHYTLENRSEASHTVGLRMMIDTFIGANDGVPFTIPSQKELLTTWKQFEGSDIPDYIQALEHPDIEEPGTIAHMGLKGFKLAGVANLEPIDKLVICRWPGSETKWSWDYRAMNDPPEEKKDSCVVLYWPYRDLEPGERRDAALTYGLNRIAVRGQGSRLGLTAGGSFRVGGEFTLTAYVKNPEPGQKVRLEQLPDGLKLVAGQEMEQTIQAGGEYSQASWRIRSQNPGKYQLEATSGPARAGYSARIRESSLFRGK